MDHRRARLVALALLAFVLFNPPLLRVFNRDVLVGGIPLLWLYLFLAWAAMIGAVALLVRRTG